MDADWRDLEAIKSLKHRYMRCIDRKLWDDLRDVFTPDATASYSSGKYAFTGRDAILGFLTKSMGSPRFLSSHCDNAQRLPGCLVIKKGRAGLCL